ncbi:Csu type fimbrial protein [Planctobacterium marinum]|uniref:hypothetical protein n=1 Tax=Planctobacterium marinum TaxID=1631968 RepID=UPI001E4BD851|nr:hypothetical protein [Planctobacterium marinum]MCC2607419.1 hypothetical protein [Planctobacterium marinum]
MLPKTLMPLLVLISVLHLPVAMAANQHENSTSIEMGGTIEPTCKVRNNVKQRAVNLDLSSSRAQRTNNVFIWCNTGQSNAQATYNSLNGGYLRSENGDSIPYLFTVANTAANLSLTSPQTVTQRTGSGTAGKDKGRVIKVTPQINGFEYAGVYRDTIEVTVSFN